MGAFNKITQGFQLGVNPPIIPGVEDWIYLFNELDFNLTFDSTDASTNKVIGITPINGAKMYKIYGTNNSFKTSSKSVATPVGPRFEEEIDINIAGTNTPLKQMMLQMAYGRVKAIVVNNYRYGDSAIELYGATAGLIASSISNNDTDDNAEGAWMIKLTPPSKIREPYAPRGVWIPASPLGVSATPPAASSANKATATPNGVVATPSSTGGTLAAGTYYYKVVAVDALGTTVGSSEVNAVTTGTTSSVLISWNLAQGATSYRIYKGTAAGAESQYFTTPSLSFTDTGVAGTAGTVPATGTATPLTVPPTGVTATAAAGGSLAAQTWYYKVTAVDALGETIGSTEASVALSGANLSAQIAWSPAVGAVSYNVYRGAAAGAESIYFNTTSLSFLDTGTTLPATFANTLAVIESLTSLT